MNKGSKSYLSSVRSLVKLLCLVMVMVTGLIFSGSPALAAGGNGAGFTILPVFPKNQQVKDAGGFSLLVKPGETQDITIQVVNQQDKKRKIQFGLNTAYTTSGGDIAYDLASKYLPKDSTRKLSIADYVQSPKVQLAEVGANQSGYLTFKVKVPDKPFSGLMLGAVFAMPVGEDSTTTTQKGTILHNEFGMAIPVTLYTNVGEKVPIKLRLNTIRPSIDNKAVGVKINVQNINPQFTSQNLNINARISKKGSNTVLHSHSVSKSSFAPNSNYDYFVSWGGKPLEPGKYHLSWKSDIGGVQNWNFERDFTITNAQAQNLNNQAGFKPNYLWLWILLGVLVLVLIVIVTYFIGRKRNQQNAGSTEAGKNSRHTR